jgi:peptidoglycan hydrolase-like protein with peptidoglycan-binding domain
VKKGSIMVLIALLFVFPTNLAAETDKNNEHSEEMEIENTIIELDEPENNEEHLVNEVSEDNEIHTLPVNSPSLKEDDQQSSSNNKELDSKVESDGSTDGSTDETDNESWTEEEIIQLKASLSKLGFPVEGEPEDILGPETEKVLNEFQTYYGLPVTGEPDEETLNKLDKMVNSPHQLGKRDELNITFKENLNKLGFNGITVTNYMGTFSVKRLKQFQEYYGLVVNGIGDDVTLAKIEEILNHPLQKGKRDEDLPKLKGYLNKLGFGKILETTYFGEFSEKKVKEFQGYYGLPKSGILEENTVAKLEEIINHPLQKGKRDEDLPKLKGYLNKLGFGKILETTYFGDFSEKKVKEFQGYYGLPKSGILEENTVAKLDEIINHPLQKGKRNKDLPKLKGYLNKLGFGKILETTYFGDFSEKKVKEFQGYYGLPKSGILEENTVAKLKEIINHPLQKGKRNNQVIALKQNLDRVGFGGIQLTNYFGSYTEKQLKKFQKKYGLKVTGIADEVTLQKINDAIHYKVARTMPSIVNGKQIYSYNEMKRDINRLAFLYPDLIETKIIGKSVDGRNIYAVKLGFGEKEIFMNGSHHAREHMTTNVLMEMIDEYARAYAGKEYFGGYWVRGVLNKVSIWFVPMVNPDGVMLVQQGASSAKNPEKVIKINKGSKDFSSWKANVRGVDLNRQYPAEWEHIRGNTGKPTPDNYKGKAPLTEPEVQAIVNFTNSHNFKTAVAYHSSGQIIYWWFHNKEKHYSRDKKIANSVSKITGYSLVKPTKNPSGGGYTDWIIQAKGIPGLTIEISPYTYGKPVPLKYWSSIWKQNRTVGLYLAKEAANR